MYRLFGGFGFEVDELGFYAAGDSVVNGAVEEDDALLEQSRVDIVFGWPLATGRSEIATQQSYVGASHLPSW